MLKSADVSIAPVDAYGQRIMITHTPMPLGALSAFVPDPAWLVAIAALREVADTPLPGAGQEAAA